MEKRGQVGTEYLIVVGFVTFIVLATLGVAYFYTTSLTEKIRFQQLKEYAGSITSTSEKVFYSGEPSRVQISPLLPEGVTNVEIAENFVRINMTTSTGESFIMFKSNVPIQGSLSTSSGVKIINIIAQAEYVLIQEE